MATEYESLAQRYVGDNYLSLTPQQVLVKAFESLNLFDSNLKECIIEGYSKLSDAQARAEFIKDFSPAKDLESHFDDEFDKAIIELREEISKAKSQANKK